MKIKSDFVTNSSSTSFILNCQVNAEIDLKGEIKKFNLKKIFQNESILRKVYNTDYYFNVDIRLLNGDEEQDQDKGTIILETGERWGENDDAVEQIVIVRMFLEYTSCMVSPSPINEVSRIIRKILSSLGKKVIYPVKVFLSQSPNGVGAGYNGDPMGLYQDYKELTISETKMIKMIFLETDVDYTVKHF